jgi:hypothetical protein
VRLVIIGTIVIIVPFFMLLLFEALVLLTPIFDLTMCISTADDVAHVEVVLGHFHWHCYKSSPMWFICWRGLRCLGCS